MHLTWVLGDLIKKYELLCVILIAQKSQSSALLHALLSYIDYFGDKEAKSMLVTNLLLSAQNSWQIPIVQEIK